MAPETEPFAGPALLSGRAAGVFFHEILGHRLESQRILDETEGRTFAKSLKTKILPDFLSITFDPTRRTYSGYELNGWYQFDDEGVAARPVTAVNKGVLESFLLSRIPVPGMSGSNGHGRRQPGFEPIARQSNLIVESTNQVDDKALRRLLLNEIVRQGKPYGLFFDEVTGGYTTTSRFGLQAFTVLPLVVYRVYPDGRPDELVRGVDIVGTPLASLAKIVATGNSPDVFNGFCGAESGSVPVSAISPMVLVSELEIQRKAGGGDRPPILGRPSLSSGRGGVQ
jgi:predicted Zn-dependent protease